MLADRTAKHPAPYAHWCLDTALSADCPFKTVGSTYLSYHAAEPVRQSVLKVMDQAVNSGSGPEELRSRLATLSVARSKANSVTPDPLLQSFLLDLFANGSGTQIYSTSFAQWSAREILRRAQPATLIIRIGPRARQRSLNEFITGIGVKSETDGPGSLIDADMAAYYTWLELAKLDGFDHAVFLAWFAGHRQAFLSGPGIAKNVSTTNPLTIADLLKLPGWT
jgi:hypothetical protein